MGDVFCGDKCYEHGMVLADSTCSSSYALPQLACPFNAAVCGTTQEFSLGSNETSLSPQGTFGSSDSCSYFTDLASNTKIMMKTLQNTEVQLVVGDTVVEVWEGAEIDLQAN